MNDNSCPADAEASALEVGFGGRWIIWLSDTGRWWAARANPPTAAERAAGCVHFLRAASPAKLRQLIEDQEQHAASARQHPAPPAPHPARNQDPQADTGGPDD